MLISVPKMGAGGVLVVHRTLLFNCVRSTEIITLSCGFGTTTIPEHQFVGSLTGTITPSCLILSNSALTLGKRGTGTRRSAVNAKGFFLLLLSSECDKVFGACQDFKRELEMLSVYQKSYLQQNQLVLPALVLVWLVDLKVAYADLAPHIQFDYIYVVDCMKTAWYEYF